MDGYSDVRCGCGTWTPLPPLAILLDQRTVVRCEECQRKLPRPLLAELVRVGREVRVREMIRLDRAGLL